MRIIVTVLAVLLTATAPAHAQARRTTPRQPAQPAVRTEPATLMCPSELGEGVQTKRVFCDVLTGRDVADPGAIVIELPPHRGDVTMTFDLHNRHTYSEELVRTNRGYRRYTATIGVLTADNTLLSRAVVQNEFRTAADLVDRIGGGAGPGGIKAVAPTGAETITLVIPAAEERVVILGEKLSVIRPDSPTPDTFSAPGRPVALISNVTLEYRPAPPTPARRTTPARRR
jgi:hypothetical protein